ncbi:MAG: cytochrome c [Planctomycetaceae bacterium]|nr:cytochrome c [Planctomycetaceae bacterium]
MCLVPLGGCAHKSQSADTAVPLTGSNLSSVDAGRSIYTGQCTACHAAESVTNYTADEWTNRIIPSMARKAGLSSDEKQAVTDYVLSVLNASS